MTHAVPPLITEAAALCVAGAGLLRYKMGPALIGAGADATVVIVEPGDNPKVSGVQDSTRVLLHGEPVPELHSRFDFRDVPPIHLFARLDQGCLPLGTARCRGRAWKPGDFNYAVLELRQSLGRDVLDMVRPVPEPGPVPGVEWVDRVEADPVRALEAFVLGWFPAEDMGPAADESTTSDLGSVPEALSAFHRLAGLRPALHRFPDPVLEQPTRATGPLGDRLVFAVDDQGCRDWSIPWPPEGRREADPVVWLTEDPYTVPETILEEEPLSRFLLQLTLYEALNAAPFHAWTYCMPAARLDTLLGMLRPVPLSPFLPTYTAEKFFVGPGLLTAVSADENEAVVSFGALHRGTLTPLLEHDFHWGHFDG